MALIDIFKPRHYLKLNILPELKDKMLMDIRLKLKTDIEPSLWRLYLGDDPNCEFPSACYDVIYDIVDEYFPENQDFRDQLAEELFDESQEFWFEISDEFKSKLIFIDNLLLSASKQIETFFPRCNEIFGDSATQLLIDLVFQYELFGYTKKRKSQTVDFRRMINISGQIIEDIFSHRIFNKQLIIGEIIRTLEPFTNKGGLERERFFKEISHAKILLQKDFFNNLKRIKKLRDKYSHGGTDDKEEDDDLKNCLILLLKEREGILPILYQNLITEN